MDLNRMRGERPAGHSTLPLGGLRIVDTARAEEAEHILSRELSRLRNQRTEDRRRFRLHMNGAHLGEVFLGFNRFSVHTKIDPGRLDNAFILSFGYETPSVLDVDSQLLVTSPKSAVMLTPSCRLRIERPAGSGMFLVRSSPEALAERFQTLSGRRLREPLRFTRGIDLSTEPGATAFRLVRFVVSELEDAGPNLGDVAHRSALQDLLLSALLTLPNNHSEDLAANYRGQISPRLVRVAEEFMEARCGEGTSIPDLLAICGCSRSILFEAFNRYRNHTPMQFLMSRRLERAQRLLLSDSHPTVTSVAHDCGFRHLGRFAGAYRARYGEAPSETIQNRPPALEPEN